MWGSDVPVFSGDEVLDEFDHCEGFEELVVIGIVPGRLCLSQLLEATLTQVCSRVLY